VKEAENPPACGEVMRKSKLCDIFLIHSGQWLVLAPPYILHVYHK